MASPPEAGRGIVEFGGVAMPTGRDNIMNRVCPTYGQRLHMVLLQFPLMTTIDTAVTEGGHD